MLRASTRALFNLLLISLTGLFAMANAEPEISKPDQAAWEFFETCAAGDLTKAWEMTAPILRKRKDVAALKSVVAELNLTPSSLWSWNVTSGTPPYAIVEGITSHRDGTKSVVRVDLVFDRGWWIYSLTELASKVRDPNQQKPRSLLRPCDSLKDWPSLPPEEFIQQEFDRRAGLILSTRKHENFDSVYPTAKGRPLRGWNARYVEIAFRLKDQDVPTNKTQLGSWKKPPRRRVDEFGTLRIGSTCDLAGHRLEMTQQYYLEASDWNYYAYSMDLLPSPQFVASFASDILKRFDAAIQEKSFASFYDHISARWKQQIKVQHLEAAFRGFWEKGVKLTTPSEVVIAQQPVTLDEDISEFYGYYDREDFRIWFQMKLAYEKPTWKLYGIDVSLAKPGTKPPSGYLKATE